MFRRRKKTTRKKKSKTIGKAGRVERERQMNQRLKYGTIAVIAIVVIVVIIGAIYNNLVLPKTAMILLRKSSTLAKNSP